MNNVNSDIEKHHLTPIALYGEDKESNIILLTHNSHVRLHQTLDIPGKIYGSRTRSIKQRSNHKLLTSPEVIDMIGELQHLFFDNLHKLPKDLQQKHLDKMREQYKEKQENYTKITGDKFDEMIPRKGDIVKSFDYALDKKIECTKEISKALYRILFNHMK